MPLGVATRTFAAPPPRPTHTHACSYHLLVRGRPRAVPQPPKPGGAEAATTAGADAAGAQSVVAPPMLPEWAVGARARGLDGHEAELTAFNTVTRTLPDG